MRRTHAWTLLALLFAPGRCDVVRFPVEVAQDGTTVDFEHAADGDAAMEAIDFCVTHMPTVDTSKCSMGIIDQLSTIMQGRVKSMNTLPGLTFQVANADGQVVQFIHEEGKNPSVEARKFCRTHFKGTSPTECIESMLINMQKALQEASQAESEDASEAEPKRPDTRPGWSKKYTEFAL